MTNPCRVDVTTWPFTAAKSGMPIPCVLDTPPHGVEITAVTREDSKTHQKLAITPAADGQSFALPIETSASYVVNVTLNRESGDPVYVVEDCADRGQLLCIAAKTANFRLKVS